MRIVNMKRVLALVLLTGAMFAGRAEAAVISVLPASSIVNVGDIITLDVVVTGLTATEAVGAVSIRLTATGAGTIVDDVDFTLDPQGKMGAEVDFGSGFGSNFIDFVFVAEDRAPAGPGPEEFAFLKPLQGTGFTVARFRLQADAEGISEIDFANVFGGYLSDADGVTPLAVSQVNGALICVGAQFAQRCQVPEPALLSLLAAGLVTAAARRRNTKR